MGDRIRVQLQLWEIYLSLTNHPGQLSLAIRPWVDAEYQPKGADALRLGVKADMVLFAGNSVIHIWVH